MNKAFFKVQINLKEYLRNGYKIKVGDVLNKVINSRYGLEDNIYTVTEDDNLDILNDIEYCSYQHTIYVNVMPV